jgi:hypothetical protein
MKQLSWSRMAVLLPAVFVVVAGCAKTTISHSAVSGTTSWRDKAIHYQITGTSGASVSSSSDNNKCTVLIQITGKKHELLVTEAGLEFQGEKIALEDFKKIELQGDADAIRIIVDGKEVYPPVK